MVRYNLYSELLGVIHHRQNPLEYNLRCSYATVIYTISQGFWWWCIAFSITDIWLPNTWDILKNIGSSVLGAWFASALRWKDPLIGISSFDRTQMSRYPSPEDGSKSSPRNVVLYFAEYETMTKSRKSVISNTPWYAISIERWRDTLVLYYIFE
jgi:hypothetical protein